MKNQSKLVYGLLLGLVLWATGSAVTIYPQTLGLGFSARTNGLGNSVFTIYGEGNVTVTTYSPLGITDESTTGIAWLKPGKQYEVLYQCAGVSDFNLSFTAPDGYAVYIDGTPRNMVSVDGLGGWHSYSFLVDLRPVAPGGVTAFGEFGGIKVGKSISWEVGLGGLRNGRDSGSIYYAELDLPSGAAARSKLYYSEPPNNGQITLIYDPSSQVLRQVLGAQGIIDLVDISGGFEMRLHSWHYSPAPVFNPLSGVWTFSDTPWKVIKVESSGAGNLKITETEGGVSRVSLLDLTSGSVSSGTYEWTLKEGDGSTWLRTTTYASQAASTGILATGGSMSTSGGYIIHTFTSSGTFNLTSNPGSDSVDTLLVGGGGGGGGGSGNNGGGGGGGGFVYMFNHTPSTGAHAISVGGGGAAGSNSDGSDGGNSSAFGNYAVGGGGGGAFASPGRNGGTGGGAGRDYGYQMGGGTGSQGGNGGGAGGWSWASAGGGGGAGWHGEHGGTDSGSWSSPYSNGGVGVSSDYSGTSIYYGGGGAGAWQTGGSYPIGGQGGGGDATGSGVAGSNGTNGLGGGGAGGQYANPGNGGSGAVIIRYEAGTAYRDVTVKVRTGGVSGTVVSEAIHRYVSYPWGEELTNITAVPGGAAANLTTSYEYYTNDADKGNYRRMRHMVAPTGNWTVWEYYNDWERRGQLKYQYAPFQDAPNSPWSAATNAGRVAYYEYEADWTGRYNRANRLERYINGTLVAKQTSAFTDVDWVADPRVSQQANGYYDASNSQQDTVEVYRTDADPDLIGLRYSVKKATEQQASYAYALGDYDHTNKTFTLNSSGSDWLMLAFNGSANSGSGTLVSSYAGFGGTLSFEGLYLIPNKSTLEVTMLSNSGHVLRQETQIYTGSGFSVVGYKNLVYNSDSGRLLSTTVNSGAMAEFFYTDGLLDKVVAEDGTDTRYTYDKLWRIATSVKKGVGTASAYITTGYTYLAQLDITTTNTINGINLITQQVVSDGTLTLTSASYFDTAGRLTQTTAPGSYQTYFSYSSGGKIVSATFPGGADKITENYLDGQLKSVSGSAEVAQFHQYDVEVSTGKTWRQSVFGGNYSAWTNLYLDWLGRQIEEWKPGFDGNATYRKWNYTTSGQLSKYEQTGRAPLFYYYNTIGQLTREGLDVDGSGGLTTGGSDRVTDHDQFIYTTDSGTTWWAGENHSVYPTTGSGSGQIVKQSKAQLWGFASNCISNVAETDIFDNWTTSTVTIDRTNKRTLIETSYPDSSTSDLKVIRNGQQVEVRTLRGATTRFEYDGLGRNLKSIDPRTGGATTVAYVANTSQFSTVTLGAVGASSAITQATYSYDSAGRVYSVKDALNKYSYTTYTDRGEIKRQWGDTTYPVEYDYNGSGQRITMTTFSGATAVNTWPSSGGNVTTWNYHAATRLLTSKVDAASNTVAYDYNHPGQLTKRTWARGTETTYGYDAATGELTSVNYSDGTPGLLHEYNRMGQLVEVTQGGLGGIVHEYDRCICGKVVNEYLDSTFYGGREINYTLSSSGFMGRTTGYTLKNGGTTEQTLAYGFDSLGRQNSVTADGVAYSYTYATDSDLIAAISNSASNWTQTRAYDSQRDLLASIGTTVSSTSLSNFVYSHDALGRRSDVAKSGALYSPYGSGATVLKTTWGYDDRSQVTSEVTTQGTGSTPLPGRSEAFTYDNLGNRLTTTHNTASASYTVNSLNQYSSRTVPGTYDVSGASNAVTVTVENSANPSDPVRTAARYNDYYFDGYPLDNSSSAVATVLDVSLGGSPLAVPAFLAQTPEAFSYDSDGNLLSDGLWAYTYDAENRLITMQTKTALSPSILPNASARRLEFKYDYLGRRIRKAVYSGYNGTVFTTTDSDTKFVYEGWNLIAELNALTGPMTLTKTYAWGLDWSGSRQGAGGVGGLLQLKQSSATYAACYDGNGNLMGLMARATGTLEAAYEYDAFGKTLRAIGSMASANPFRYSTKYTDNETDLIYYGMRYYSPSAGRFINKDPIEEMGGINLYGFAGNDGINRWDYLGMVLQQVSVYRCESTTSGGFPFPFIDYNDCKWYDEWYDDGMPDPTTIDNGGGGGGGDLGGGEANPGESDNSGPVGNTGNTGGEGGGNSNNNNPTTSPPRGNEPLPRVTETNRAPGAAARTISIFVFTDSLEGHDWFSRNMDFFVRLSSGRDSINKYLVIPVGKNETAPPAGPDSYIVTHGSAFSTTTPAFLAEYTGSFGYGIEYTGHVSVPWSISMDEISATKLEEMYGVCNVYYCGKNGRVEYAWDIASDVVTQNMSAGDKERQRVLSSVPFAPMN